MEPANEPKKNYHTYDSNPMPWWLALLWLCFFIFAFVYLYRYLPVTG